MKKLALILSLFISFISFSQDFTEISLFDLSGVTGDTIKSISLKPSRTSFGRLIEVDFTSINCNTLEMNIGYGLGDISPSFLDTIPYTVTPIVLDKTLNTITYNGVESNSVSVDIFPYDGNYAWIQLIYDAGCTSGELKVRIDK